MTSILSTAVSGLTAQSARLAVSAGNVANLRSTGVRPGEAPQAGQFVPQQVALTSLAGGGVRASALAVDPPSVAVYEPGAPDADAGGMAYRPNIDLARELVIQLEAQRSFEANLKVIEAEDERLGELLDVIS